MTWIPDLSPAAYIIGAPFVRAVGWLSNEHSFPTGAVPAEFVDRLSELARRAGASEFAYALGHFMGFHVCELCPPEATRTATGLRNISASNFCVPFEHLLFVCPELVPHYVRDHGYRPPDEFITAVLETPLPEELETSVADTDTGEPASPRATLRELMQAMDKTDYGRIAAAFRQRLELLGALDGAATSASSSRWTAKGQCARCGRWTYGHDAGALTCCGTPVVHVETRTIDAAPPIIVAVVGEKLAARSVGRLLAERNVWRLRDADDFQSPAIVAKLRRGEALTDDDCAPWLEDLRGLCVSAIAAGDSLVLACPTLQAPSRRGVVAVAQDVPGVHVVRLGGAAHPFATGGDDGINVDSVAAPDSIVARIVERLALKGPCNDPNA